MCLSPSSVILRQAQDEGDILKPILILSLSKDETFPRMGPRPSFGPGHGPSGKLALLAGEAFPACLLAGQSFPACLLAGETFVVVDRRAGATVAALGRLVPVDLAEQGDGQRALAIGVSIRLVAQPAHSGGFAG